MRLAIIADSHFDTGSRMEECVRIHDWIAEDMKSRGIDLILHAGDVYERKSIPEERLLVAAWVKKAADVAPMVFVRGNHDPLEDLPLLSKLKTRHPVYVEEAASVVHVAGAAVGCLAWPRKGRLLSQIAANVGIEEAGQIAAVQLQNVIRGLGQEMAAHDGPRIFLSHAMVSGALTSTGQPLVGCDMEIGLVDLGLAGADFYALGHIHMPQDWEIDGAPVVYPGSPRRTSFGEIEEKGYVVVDVHGPGDVEWKRIPTPATPMILIDGDWNGPGAFDAIVADGGGAEIRFRYRVNSDDREAARDAAAALRDSLLEAGALVVKVEERVRPTARARVPEIVDVQGVEEKLPMLWKARGEVPDPERAKRLLSHVRTIEEEVRDETR